MYSGGKNVLTRFLRRFFIRYSLPFYKKWFNKKILKYDVENIIVFDSLLSEKFIEWLYKKTNVNIHVWYWNIVKNSVPPYKLKDEYCKKWSFSSKDAEKYNMKFNPPFFFYEIKCLERSEEYDILFVGKDKGRLSELLKLRDKFTQMGFKCKFIITPTRKYYRNVNYSKPISYEENFRLTCHTKALLDYIEINNSGQSMRMMEALFREKKVITNNVLIKNYDFYNKNNIFILEEDGFSTLKDFVNSPYSKVNQSIILKYDFDNFFLRFFGIGELENE